MAKTAAPDRPHVTASSGGPPTAQTRWDIVALVVLAGVIAGMQVGKVAPAIPALRQELALDLVTAGWVASLFNAVGAAGGILVGVLTDRLNARRVLLACLGFLAAGSLMGGGAGSVAILLLSRLVESIGFVGLTVAAPKLIAAAAAPHDRGLAIGFWGAYLPLGMAPGMFIAPYLLQTVGWRGLWYVNAAVAVVFLVLLLWLLRPKRWPQAPGASRRIEWAGIGATLKRPGPWLLGIVFAFYTIQFFAVMTWLPTFLVEAQGHSLTHAAVFTALVVLANAVGNLCCAWLMHRGATRPLLIAVAYVAMATCGAGIFIDAVPAWLKLPLAFAFSGIGGLMPAATLAAAPAHAPSPGQIALANGFVVQGANTGSVIGPPVMAAIVAASGGWQASYALMLTCGGLGLLMTLVLALAERRLT